jgi:Sulfotransferase family
MAEPFPFIVGCGRSGTTLLRAMLERHPSLAIPPESYFPISLAPSHSGRPFDRETLIADLMENPRFADWQLAEPAARAAIQGASDFPSAIRSLFAAYAAAAGKARYGDKTPPFVLHIPELAEMFPEAVFIHVIRDGRDVAASLTQTDFGTGSTLRAADIWVRRVRRGRASGSRLGPSRYLEIRYEALVQDPSDTIEDVARFVGIEPIEDMLHPELGSSSIPPRERLRHAGLIRPITVGLRDWRTEMASRDVAAVEAVAGELLSELGYERRYPQPPAAARARAAASRASTALVRRARRGARAAREALDG